MEGGIIGKMGTEHWIVGLTTIIVLTAVLVMDSILKSAGGGPSFHYSMIEGEAQTLIVPIILIKF